MQGRNLVVGGGGLSTTAPDFLLARYRGDGTLDPRFGEGGRVITAMPSADGANGVEAVAVAPDRRVVAVGTAGLGSGNNIGFAVARYRPDGRLDQAFGEDGVAITPVGPVGDGGASGLAIAPDGKIVVVGGTNDADNNATFAVVRYLPNGALDTAFRQRGHPAHPVGRRRRRGERGGPEQPDPLAVTHRWPRRCHRSGLHGTPRRVSAG